MSFLDFQRDPWRAMQARYEDSPINIRPAPEYASGEVLLASVMRSVGFGVAEGDVPRRGRAFDKATGGRQGAGADERVGGILPETWSTVLHGILESPKQPNQSSKRFLSLSPVIPDASLYSASARLSGNSWNPGVLVWRMIVLGCPTEGEARTLWYRLFQALSVSASDDVWARWIDEQFVARRLEGDQWKQRDLAPGSDFAPATKAVLAYPAKRFVRDLDSIIGAKSAMTRRQWVSLVESVLRIGVVAHVLWLCEINYALWAEVEKALRGEPVTEGAGLRALTQRGALLSFGNPSAAHIKDRASRYLIARLGLNALLWSLADANVHIAPLDSHEGLQTLVAAASAERDRSAKRVLEVVGSMRDEHARTLNCKKGIGVNLIEFARHVLGQRQTANDALRGYDQGYYLRKRGSHSSAPWVVSLGPAALLAVVHCCLHGAAGPSSIRRLSAHLEDYGLNVDRDDIAKSELGHKLRMLGLVLDSPDAESGMLLVAPFNDAKQPAGESQ